MPRPQKDGIDYFPLDVNFFSDPKIKILKARYGVDGITVYLYLLCEIYRAGYYICFNEDSQYLISDDLKMNTDKVKQVLNFLLERSLFDNKLFQSDKILTSAGIQKRFQLAVKERAKKTPIEIEGFWLLKEQETESFIKVNSSSNTSWNNEDTSRKNGGTSWEESLKESKGKESKGKEIKTVCPELQEDSGQAPSYEYELVLNDGTKHLIYGSDIEKYRQLYPAIDIDQEFRKMVGWIDANPRKRKTKSGICQFMNSWLSREQDSSKPERNDSQKKNQFQQFPQRNVDYDAIVLDGLVERK